MDLFTEHERKCSGVLEKKDLDLFSATNIIEKTVQNLKEKYVYKFSPEDNLKNI